jgi:hypothetical protein
VNKDIPSIEQLQFLATLNIGFYATVPHFAGATSVFLTPAQLIEYATNPDLYVAKTWGVSLEDYLAWRDEGFGVRCAALTSKKRRCRNYVTGGSSVEPNRWVEMQGHYCDRHEIGNP